MDVKKEKRTKETKNRRKREYCFIVLAIILFLALTIPSVLNRRDGNFEALDKCDQEVLKELDYYLAVEGARVMWKDYQLGGETILAINKEAGHAFLINPEKPVHSFFAKELRMPQECSIRAYRISNLAPQMLRFKLAGNFNTIGKEYKIFGNSVYFTKYDESSVEALQSSRHYITFLCHEAFHYYMQDKWPEAGRFDTSVLDDEDLDLMEVEYKVLGEIYDALEKD